MWRCTNFDLYMFCPYFPESLFNLVLLHTNSQYLPAMQLFTSLLLRPFMTASVPAQYPNGPCGGGTSWGGKSNWRKEGKCNLGPNNLYTCTGTNAGATIRSICFSLSQSTAKHRIEHNDRQLIFKVGNRDASVVMTCSSTMVLLWCGHNTGAPLVRV